MSENVINEAVVEEETVTQSPAEEAVEAEDTMKYYRVDSSHWPLNLEFKSKIKLEEGQCFRIKEHDGNRPYPTRLKVTAVSDTQSYDGTVVEILEVDTDVEPF